MDDDSTLSRKRPRQDANITDSSNSTKEQNFLTPHTLRLLKLVEEGTTEHARLAAHHLSEITSGSSPLVLWDILGRLQGYLTSPQWMTRHNASVAMEGVAQRLPVSDQQDFLHQTATTYRDQDSPQQTSWLTLNDLADHLTIILKNGRTLLSKAENDYDQWEEDELDNLDSTYHEQDRSDFVERRTQLQRQILARRLGLSHILSHVSGKQMETVFSTDDFQPYLSCPPTKIMKRTNQGRTNECTIKSIRSLLVSEIQQQQEQQKDEEHQLQLDQDSTPMGQSHRLISHRNAQRLLATELVFRMFDASWHVRHGSLMGLLALLRAWNVHGTSYLGIWPQDILARCLCVLALDRFADYSETSTSSGGGGIVAPVREMAGQVIAVLYQSAAESLQKQALDVLVTLSTRQQYSELEDWEIRHAALLALVYISALQVSYSAKSLHSVTVTERSSTSFQTILQVATTSLSDHNEDVKGKAAQLLIPLLSDKTRLLESKQLQLYPRIVNYLWEALTMVNLISSSVKDLVGLLSTLISADLAGLLDATHPKPTHQDACTFLLSKLKILTTCPYISVKTLVIALIGVALEGVVNFLNSEASTSLTSQSRSDIADSFLEVAKMLYRLYFERGSLLDDVVAQDRDAFIEACNTTWLSVTVASRIILKGFEQKRLDLESSMLLHYFDLRPLDYATHMDFAHLLEASFASRHALRITVADAIAIFLGQPDDCHYSSSSYQVLELCIRVCLESPFALQCEGAGILLTRCCHHYANPSFPAIFEKCKGGLLKVIEETPRCVAMDKKRLQEIARSNVQALQHSFACGMKILNDSNGNVDKVVSTILRLWKEVIDIPGLDSKNGHISLDTMRLSVVAAGALVSRGLDHLPHKLTPIVRSLMTSIQNELDEDCRGHSCRHMVSLLEILSGVLPNERQEALSRTRSKVLQNLCKLIKANVKPGCSNASYTVSLLISGTDRPLPSFEAIWESMSVLADTQDSQIMGSLLIFDAVCSDIGRNRDASELVISTFLPPMVSRHCFSLDVAVSSRTRSCVESMVKIRQVSALPVVLPPIALLCKSESDDVRERACDLLCVVISGPAMELCPFVRSLLPLAMQLMTDSSSSSCAKTASRIFSKLVQLAPLVEESAEIRLITDGWSDNADKVMDHLIRGKALPPCEIDPNILDALSTAGVSLRHYQLEGIAWLRFLQSVKLNGALTDSMGLGKTLQALVGVALAHTDTHAMGVPKKSIVICPSSVLGHWMKEVKTFFPGNDIFRPFCLQGQKGKKQVPEECNLIITSYAILRSDIDFLSRYQWCYCVLDEGHLLKNPKTATAKAARKLHAHYKLILTGTPVQNKVHEVWATFDFLMPNFLGSSSEFSKEFAGPIIKGQAQGASATDIAAGMEKLKLLHQQVLPFILRREKEQVLQELPPKIITTIPCEMTSMQLRLYQDFCSSNEGQNSLKAIDQVLQEPSTERAPVTLGSDVLKALLYLRLLCTHPALVNSKGFAEGDLCNLVDGSGKLLALKELLRESGMPCQDLSAADNDTSLMYVNAENSDDLNKDDIESVFDPSCSDDALPLHSSANHMKGCKFLIFTQFTFSLDVVEEFLRRYFPGTQYLRLDGKVPIEKRSEIVDSFNSQQKIQILLLTTRIGGLGLNLTGADTVVFLEHDWNPHADLQAMDRAHRIGQKKTVHVYKLVTSNSIEEKIMTLHETKLAMSNAIVNTENSTLYSMGTDQLLDIFRFRSDKSDSNAKNCESSLDILVERYEDEYSSLVLSDFIESLSNRE